MAALVLGDGAFPSRQQDELRGSANEAFGLEVAPTDGPQLAAFIQKETVFWHALIKERHLTLD